MAFWSFRKSRAKPETRPLFEPGLSGCAMAGVPGAWAIAGVSGAVWAIAGTDTDAHTKANMMAEILRILTDTPNEMESRCRDFISGRDSLSIRCSPYLRPESDLVGKMSNVERPMSNVKCN